MTSMLISRSTPSSLNKLFKALITGFLALAMGVSGLSSASANHSGHLLLGVGGTVLADSCTDSGTKTLTMTANSTKSFTAQRLEFAGDFSEIQTIFENGSILETTTTTTEDPEVVTITITALAVGIEKITVVSTFYNPAYLVVTVLADDATFFPETDCSTANDVPTLGLVGTTATSDDEAVATAEVNLAGTIDITSVAVGSATITVSAGGNDATIAVTVAADGAITIGAITPYEVSDNTPPFIVSIGEGPSSVAGYRIGDTDLIDITFNEDIEVVGSPRVTFRTNDGFNVVLNYETHTASVMTVSYQLEEDVTPQRLFGAVYTFVPESSTVLIRDLFGNFITDLEASLANVEFLPSRNGLISELESVWDVVRPRVSNITIPQQNGVLNALTRDGLYLVGESLPIRLQFDDDIFVTNSESITITMNSGGTAFLIGNDDDYIEFAYVVQPGDSSTAMDLNVASIQLNGALIKDVNGNDASLELPEANEVGSLNNNRDITVDASAPTSLQVVPGPGSLSVTVDAPTWSPTVYSFEVSANGVTWQGISSTSTRATIGGLLGGTNYQVRVAGVAIIPDLENRILVNGRSKMVVAGFVSGSGRTDSVAGTPGPAGPAGASTSAASINTQQLAVAIANSESATAIALDMAKVADQARSAADLAKTEALSAAQLARTTAQTLAAELALLALKKNSITIKKGTSTSRIDLNLSDDHADSEGVVQIKKPGSKKYITSGTVMLDGAGDGFLKVKGAMKAGTAIRVLIDGAILKSMVVK